MPHGKGTYGSKIGRPPKMSNNMRKPSGARKMSGMKRKPARMKKK